MGQIIRNLSNEEYHDTKGKYGEYISSTQLKDLLVSPKYFKYNLDNPKEEKSSALKLGSLFHSLMEQLSKAEGNWDKGYDNWRKSIAVFEAPLNPKTNQPYGKLTKAYNEAYIEFVDQNITKEIVSEEEVSYITEMANAMMFNCGETSKQITKLLKWGKEVETSYFYESENGIKLKVRPDLLTNSKIVDWKTTSIDILNEEEIAKTILKYNYHISLTMYQHVIHEITGKWYSPILVFVQKNPPFDCVVCDISEWCYNYDKNYDYVDPGIGAMEFKKLLNLYEDCLTNDKWYGAERTIPEEYGSILRPAIPTWLMKKYYEV